MPHLRNEWYELSCVNCEIRLHLNVSFVWTSEKKEYTLTTRKENWKSEKDFAIEINRWPNAQRNCYCVADVIGSAFGKIFFHEWFTHRIERIDVQCWAQEKAQTILSEKKWITLIFVWPALKKHEPSVVSHTLTKLPYVFLIRLQIEVSKLADLFEVDKLEILNYCLWLNIL